jgi:integrase
MPTTKRTYEVRIWSTAPYSGKRGRTYRVRWRVGHKTQGKTFATRKAAESFRSELITAHRKGEPFDLESGLPPSMLPSEDEVSWFEHACDFVDLKWPRASARHRKGIAEALAGVTTVLLTSDRGAPDATRMRQALNGWAFNTATRGRPAGTAEPPAEFADVVTWIRARSIPIGLLRDPQVSRRAIEACGVKLDGSSAAAATTARKRSALFSALEYAVELRRLPSNPMESIKAKRSTQFEVVDRRVVVNPAQARLLLAAVHNLYPSLEAFFACLYYAGLRPAEARHLRRDDLHLPEHGWGELTLRGSTQASGTAWSDSHTADEDRPLKHRTTRHVRQVPAHPDLVATLRRHLDQFECSPDGRLFVSRFGIAGRPLPRPLVKPLPMGTAYRVWKLAREQALEPREASSPLAGRPYDLRHACVSTWLNAGVPATQVAEWAGHSVHVLLRVYAKCVYGQEEQARQRIEAALHHDE